MMLLLYCSNFVENFKPSYLVIPVDFAFQTRENLHEMLYKMGLEKLLEQHSRNIIGGYNILTSQLKESQR